MSIASGNNDRSLDWITFSLYICLVLVGWLMIYTVGYGDGYSGGIGNFFRSLVGKQTIWIGISFIVMFFVFIIDWKFWQTFSAPIYIFSLLLLVAVLFLGTKIKGATSWFNLGGFAFQPSEFAKFATCIVLSSYLGSYGTDLRETKHQLISLGLISFPIILILLQPDAGSALVFISFVMMLYRAGMSSSYYIVGGVLATILILSLKYPTDNVILGMILLSMLIFAFNLKRAFYPVLGVLVAIALAVYLTTLDHLYIAIAASTSVLGLLSFFLWNDRKQRIVSVFYGFLILGSLLSFSTSYAFNNILKPHQQDRLNVWLSPEKCDPRGSLYNVIQSKTSIASGEVLGKGFLQGLMTKLDYVPEQSTDFIFCTIGEEQGFLGSMSIMLLFLMLLYRLLMLAERQRSVFSRYYCYGIAGIIFTHFFINIGMTMGLVPIIGIPLPFVSRGGSSLLIFTIMIALVLKLDSNRYRI